MVYPECQLTNNLWNTWPLIFENMRFNMSFGFEIRIKAPRHPNISTDCHATAVIPHATPELSAPACGSRNSGALGVLFKDCLCHLLAWDIKYTIEHLKTTRLYVQTWCSSSWLRIIKYIQSDIFKKIPRSYFALCFLFHCKLVDMDFFFFFFLLRFKPLVVEIAIWNWFLRLSKLKQIELNWIGQHHHVCGQMEAKCLLSLQIAAFSISYLIELAWMVVFSFRRNCAVWLLFVCTLLWSCKESFRLSGFDT